MKLSRVVIHTPLLSYSGGAKFIFKIAKEIAKSHEVIVLSRAADESIFSELSHPNIRLVTNTKLTSSSIIYWLCFPISITYDILATCFSLKEDDILLSFLFPSNFICVLANLIKKTPHNHYCFEPYPHLQNQLFIKSFPSPGKYILYIYSSLFKRLDSFGVKSAKTVFTLNSTTQMMIEKVYGVKSIVTLMGVDTNHFKPRQSNKFTLLLKTPDIVVHSTDYSPLKNTDLAIRAMSKAIEKFPNAMLVITSTQPDSPQKSRYVKLVETLRLENNVTFLDFVKYHDLPILYSNATCYISASKDEMLGTTSSNLPVKESLACGTPAIRANITTEDVEDGISGYLVDPEDIAVVSSKIIYLLSHKLKAQAMGLAGRKKIIELYNWDEVGKVIIRHLN